MPKPGPAVVYRFYNEAGLCLYVGISQDFSKRWHVHERQRVWWSQTARCVVDFYPDWPTASQVEEISLATERPVYDRARSPLAFLHIIELTRLLEGGQVPADNEQMTTMMWSLAGLIAEHLGKST